MGSLFLVCHKLSSLKKMDKSVNLSVGDYFA